MTSEPPPISTNINKQSFHQQRQSSEFSNNSSMIVGPIPISSIKELNAIVPTVLHHPQECDLQQHGHNPYEMSQAVASTGQELLPVTPASVSTNLQLLNDSNKTNNHSSFADSYEVPRDGSATSLIQRRSSMMSLPGQSELFTLTRDSPQNMGNNRTSTQSFTLQPTKTQDGGNFITSNMEQHQQSSVFMFGADDKNIDKPPQDQPEEHCGIDEDKPVHECTACGKRLCSMRSLKRHRSTCKRVKTQQDIQGEQPSSMSKIQTPSSQKTQLQKSETNPISLKSEKAQYSKKCQQQQLILNNETQPQTASSASNLRQQNVAYKSDLSNQQAKNDGIFLIQQQPTEPSKVSDVVDSVVAKLRLQSGVSQTNSVVAPPQIQHLNQIQHQHILEQQQQNIQPRFNMPAEWTNPTSFVQQSQQNVYSQNNHYLIPTEQQYPTQFQVEYRQQPTEQQFKNSILNKSESMLKGMAQRCRDPLALPSEGPQMQQQSHQQQQQQMEPPKSAPVPTTTSIQQFWPVMGARIMQPMPTTMVSGSTASSLQRENIMHRNEANKLICSPPPYPGNASAQILAKRESCNLVPKQQTIDFKQPFEEVMGSPPGLTPTTTRAINANISVENSSNVTVSKQQSGAKNVYRYLCPECEKPYSCRKNVKRHRVSQHKVPTQEAQEGFIKRIRLSEAEIQQLQQVQTKVKNELPDKQQDVQCIGQQSKITKSEKGQEEKTIPCAQFDAAMLQSNQKPADPKTHKNGIQPQQQPFSHHSNSNPIGPPRSAPLPNQTHPQQQQFFAYQNRQYCIPNNGGDQSFAYPPMPTMEQYYGQHEALQQQQQNFYVSSQQQTQVQPITPSVQYQRYQTVQPIHLQQQQINQQQRQQQIEQKQQRNELPQEEATIMRDAQQQQHYHPIPGPSCVVATNTHFQQAQQQYHQTQMEAEVGYASNNAGVYCSPSHHFNGPNCRPIPGLNGTNIGVTCMQQQQPQAINNVAYQQQQQLFFEQQHQQPGTAFVGGRISDFETLECWDQIKSGVDAVHTNAADAIEMARIVEDLKKTEQTEQRKYAGRAIQQQIHQQHQANGQLFSSSYHAMNIQQQQHSTESGEESQQPDQRQAVELAEADTTFSPPSLSDDSAATVARKQQYAKMIQHNHLVPVSPNYPMLSTKTAVGTQIFQYENATGPVIPAGLQAVMKNGNNIIGETGSNNNNNSDGGFVEFGQQKFMTIWGAQGGFVPTNQQFGHQHPVSLSNGAVINANNNAASLKVSTVANKKQLASGKTPINNNTANFVCPACQKGYSTDYSLKRHRQVCPVLTGGKDGAGSGLTRKRKNNLTASSGSNSKGKRVDEHHQIDPDSTMNESPPTDEASAGRHLSDAAFIVRPPNNSMESDTGTGNKNAQIHQQFFPPHSAVTASSQSQLSIIQLQ